MSPEVIKGIKLLISKRVTNLNKLILSWFGGEPLVAKDIVLDISKYAFDISKRNPSLLYQGAMSTNGYLLTGKLFSELVKLGLNSYQISIDGPHEVHNQTRRRIDGKGTFERIWSNLLEIRDSELQANIVLRLHLTQSNILAMESLINNIEYEFGSSKMFSVFFKPVEKLGGGNDNNLNVISTKDQPSIIRELKSKLKNVRCSNFEENDMSVCYAAKPNSLAIRSDGSLSKCTVALREQKNHIGKINSDGTLEINHQKLAPWLRGFENMDKNVLGCPLINFPTS